MSVKVSIVVVFPGTTSVWVICILLSFILDDYSGSWHIENFIVHDKHYITLTQFTTTN